MTHLPADTDGVEQWVFVVDDDEAMLLANTIEAAERKAGL